MKDILSRAQKYVQLEEARCPDLPSKKAREREDNAAICASEEGSEPGAERLQEATSVEFLPEPC